jgi:hypothetical protein
MPVSRFCPSVIPAITLLLLASSGMSAQERGSISGTITNRSGAGVPGMDLLITHKRMNVSRTAATNAAGFYTVGELITDRYTISAEAKGFKRAKQAALYARCRARGSHRPTTADWRRDRICFRRGSPAVSF